MFDLMNTRIGALLNTARTISFAEVWMAVFRDQRLKDQVLNWIRQDQLFNEGIDENGVVIGTYSEATGDSIVVDADPIKVDENGETTNLFNEYGDGIIGLTDENKTRLAQELVERFNTEYRRLLSIN